MKRLKYLLALSVLYPATPVDAQIITPPANRRSMFSNAASIFTVSPGSRVPANTDEEIYLKPPRDQSSTPQAWTVQPASLNGQYSMQELFGSVQQGNSTFDMTGHVEIDGLSSGNAFIPTDDGVPVIGNAWAAVMISVDNDSDEGLPGQGWFSERANGNFNPNRLTPGADLVTHFFEDSGGIHHSIRGETLFMQLAEHVGLTGNQDIDSIDLAAGVIRESGALATKLLFRETAYFYFTVSRQSALDLNYSFPNGFAYETDSYGIASLVQADAAAVYTMTWDDANHAWGVINVYLSRDDLDIGSGGDENIDAISVQHPDPQLGAVGPMIFSMQPASGRSQLLVFEPDTVIETNVGDVFELMADDAPNSPSAVEAMGLKDYDPVSEGDDIDAICTFDPELADYDDVVGFSVDTVEPEPLGLAIQRIESNGTDDKLTFQITGQANPLNISDVAVGQNPVSLVYFWAPGDSPSAPPAPGDPGWTLLTGALHPGLVSEATKGLPAPNVSDRWGEVYFYAETRDRASKLQTLLRRSWVSVLEY